MALSLLKVGLCMIYGLLKLESEIARQREPYLHSVSFFSLLSILIINKLSNHFLNFAVGSSANALYDFKFIYPLLIL